MQNFDDIKNLYQHAEEKDLPSAQEIIRKVEASRKKMMLKNVMGIFLLASTFIFISVIGYYYDFKIWTTFAGIAITLVAIILGILFSGNLAKSLMKRNDPTLDNNAYLQQLIEFRNKQRKVQTTGMTWYFILLSAGLILYMVEFAMRDLQFGLTAYALTGGWILFNWFYIRKKTIAKQEKQINEQISSLEELIKRYSSTL